jgi:hypothetical protein
VAKLGPLDDAYIEVDGVDLSSFFSSFEVTSSKDTHDVTGMGASFHEMRVGLGDGQMSGEAHLDYATSGLVETLWPIHINKELVDIVVKPDPNQAKSFLMSGYLAEFNPVGGGIDGPATTTVTFINGSQNGIQKVAST